MTKLKSGQRVSFKKDVALVSNPEPNFKDTDEVMAEIMKFGNLLPGVPVVIKESKLLRGDRWYKTNQGWINSMAFAGNEPKVLRNKY